ncbi:MAG: hypothetical protein V3U11_10260 [Planctomycetota bacterium]
MSNNSNATTLDRKIVSINPQNAIQIQATTPVVFGFEIFTKSSAKRTFPAYIYLPDSKGLPQANPLATTSITTDTRLGWYRAAFAKPVILGTNKTYFISWEPGKSLNKLCEDPKAKGGTTWTHYHKTFFFGRLQWFGPFKTEPWAFRVLCSPRSNVNPILSSTGAPSLGNKSFAVNLSGATTNARVIAAFGSSNTSWNGTSLPLDMSPMGAPKCSLLVSPDLFVFLSSDANGRASVTLPIPNDSKLLGKNFHCQWAIADSTANQLGMILSNGGSGVLGKPEE